MPPAGFRSSTLLAGCPRGQGPARPSSPPLPAGAGLGSLRGSAGAVSAPLLFPGASVLSAMTPLHSCLPSRAGTERESRWPAPDSGPSQPPPRCSGSPLSRSDPPGTGESSQPASSSTVRPFATFSGACHGGGRAECVPGATVPGPDCPLRALWHLPCQPRRSPAPPPEPGGRHPRGSRGSPTRSDEKSTCSCLISDKDAPPARARHHSRPCRRCPGEPCAEQASSPRPLRCPQLATPPRPGHPCTSGAYQKAPVSITLITSFQTFSFPTGVWVTPGDIDRPHAAILSLQLSNVQILTPLVYF